MANHLLLLQLLALCTLLAFANGIQVSIDCGSSVSYKDANNISWIGDDKLIRVGEPIVVDTSTNPTLSRSMTTMRVFAARKKNCYSIDAMKGEKVLVRASFYYGNYDMKSSPPIFFLLLDGNYWNVVDTSSDLVVFHEAIYVTRSKSISVCVAQARADNVPLADNVPFISAIEVRSLSMGMYESVDPNYALVKRRRVTFGTEDIIRYPVDPYDRIWLPASNAAELFTAANNTAPKINISHLGDNPPEAVLRNAFIFKNTSLNIQFGTNLPTSIEVSVYMHIYFSEVFQLNSTEERSFTLSIDDNFTTPPIIPPYGDVLELKFSNITASGNTSFALQATKNATLPPLVNALEVYSLSDALTDGTDVGDVEGLNVLKDAFDVLNDWTGDPCLPAEFAWDWINCSDDATPRVTELHLGSFNLSGELPAFSSMDALTTIDMHNNKLKGAVPDFLGTLPSLRLLNLADNEFNGTIPATLSENTLLKIDLSGNPGLSMSGESSNGTETTTGTAKSPTSSPSGSERKHINLVHVLIVLAAPVFLFG